VYASQQNADVAQIKPLSAAAVKTVWVQVALADVHHEQTQSGEA